MSWIEDPGDWPHANLSALGVDEGFLNVTSELPKRLWLYTLSADCVRCPFRKFAAIDFGQSWVKINTKRALKFRVVSEGNPDNLPTSDLT